MFVVENEAAGLPLCSLDVGAMDAFGLKPEAKCRLMSGDTQLAIDAPSSKFPQWKDDIESVRRKLCDSLTSALEMVVSKQLVKSVLGVVKDADAPKVGDLHRHVQFQEQDGMGLDLKDKFQYDLKAKKDGNRTSFPLLPTSGKSEESPTLKFYSESEDGFVVTQETTGGLELMEQARRVARNVELSLFSVNGGVNKKYKEKARSLLFNLKDRSNPELRARVFDGEITPKILVRMSAEQFASKELSQWRTAKAEEFASMVVLTDADLDPRQIVKKTHKGEFQLVAEEVDFSATTSGTSPPPGLPLDIDGYVRESKQGYPSSGRAGILGTKSKILNDLYLEENRSLGQVKIISSFQERVGKETSAKERAVINVTKDLCTMDARNEAVSEVAEQSLDTTAAAEARTFDAFNLTPTALNSHGEMLEKFLVSYPDSWTPKLRKLPNTRCTESGGVRSFLSERSERFCGAAVWEGSIQLSATRFALILGFYESGERLELKDWPRSVEVKGRVRLVVLDKFLQDLQLSRSRTVTILSLCPSDCQGEAKQSTAYLKQMADQYRIGGRAGFVEPLPGFELYLVPPSSLPLEPSNPEDLGSIKATSKRDDVILFGVVVWRKSQAQGVPFSRGPNRKFSVQEVAIPNVVHESLAKIDVKPSHCKETPVDGGLPASLETASTPSLVYVGSSSSMHSTEPRRDGSTEHNPASGRDWHPPSTTAIDHRAPALVSADEITENANGSITKSVSRLQYSIDLEDVPPGFLFRPVQSSQIRPEALIAESSHTEGFQAALTNPTTVICHASQVPFQCTENFKDAPSGSLQHSSVNFPEWMHISAVDEDDDLPEFNFDVEGMVSYGSNNYMLPANSSHFSSLQPHNIASQSFARMHTVSDISKSHHGHRHNVYGLHLPGGHPLGHKTQYEESFAQDEGWSGLEGRAETLFNLVHDFPMGVLPSTGQHERSTQLRAPTTSSLTGEDALTMTPLNGTDDKTSQQRGPLKRTAACEEEPCMFGCESKRALACPFPVPPTIPSSQLSLPSQAMGKVAEQTFPRIDIPRQQAPSLSLNAVLPSLPPVSGEHPVHSRHQLSLVHMVVQHQHSMMKSRAISWRPRNAPFLNKEPWRQHQHDVATCKPSEWQQLGSVQMHYRSEKIHRKSMDSYIPSEDTSAELMRSGKEGMSNREQIQRCGRSPSIRRHPKTRGDMTPASAGAKEAMGDDEPLIACSEPKSLKRGRERERDQ